MSEKLKESLSAVIDDEADEFELRRVLDEIGKDPELKQSWERYYLIGSAIRGEGVADFGAMREKIWAEIQIEGDDSRPPLRSDIDADEAEPAKRVVVGRWTSLAVAATVAFVVVVGLGNLGEMDGDAVPGIADSETAVTAQQNSLNQVVALKSEVTASDEVRTDAYKIYHSQQRGMNQAGFGAFAKMVIYQRD
ncbi:MAG: sigma-E factor negative regulatory protein [Pseudomonadales bacterium]